MASLPRTRLWLAFATAGALVVGGCDDSPTETTEDVGADMVTEDVAMDGDTSEAVACISSNGCQAVAGQEGRLCVDRFCADCATDAECAADPSFGDGATCAAGRCAACVAGTLDCPCDPASGCSEGVCDGTTCVECIPGTLECACNEDGTCDVGGRCASDGSACETCPPGERGCPCDTGDACTDTADLCVMGLCAEDPCAPGQADCPCDLGETCDDGLGCHPDMFCRTCDADAVGCACDTATGCTMDLVCDGTEQTCRAPLACADTSCLAFQTCSEGAAGEDATCDASCVAGYTWDGAQCVADPTANCAAADPNSILTQCTGLSRECVEDMLGASCGDCLSGFVDENATCRPVLACADIQAMCDDAHRACVDGNGVDTDAVCGDCVLPWVEQNGVCEIPDSATCADGDPASLKPICDGQQRECVDPDPGAPSCGDCLAPLQENPASGLCEPTSSCVALGCAALGRTCEGTVPFETCGQCTGGLVPSDPGNPNSACRGVLTCADLTCGGGEFCVEGAASDATCVTSTCAAGEAFDQIAQMCTSCNGSCTAEGTTGRFWIDTLQGGECICETQTGYYLDTTAALVPRPCDADGDGWVNEGAGAFVGHPDPALRVNARCSLRTIDRVTLRNEFGQEQEVLLCEEGNKLASAGACIVPKVVSLYETKAQDDAAELALNPTPFPVRGDRRPVPAELNPLTKACVLDADYNHNGIRDSDEAQGMVPGAQLSSTQLALLDFGFYAELHRSWWEPRPSNDADTVVIAERSRCADGSSTATPFFLGYDEPSGSAYWRECTRNRDRDFDSGVPTPSLDFARWSCGQASGSCPALPPPTQTVASTEIPPHGLCEVALPPADGLWRGMNHHSQFRCAEVVSSPVAANEVAPTELFDPASPSNQSLVFNACAIDCPGSDPACAADCASGRCTTTSEVAAMLPNPDHMLVGCTQRTASVGEVGFVSVRYEDAPQPYNRGCVDESQWTTQLCPGGSAVASDGVFNDFGALACGCGANFGGEFCDLGCTDVSIDPNYSIAPRAGWWMCNEPVVTSMTGADQTSAGPAFTGTNPLGAWEIRTRISTSPRDRTPLCEGGTCGSGYAVY